MAEPILTISTVAWKLNVVFQEVAVAVEFACARNEERVMDGFVLGVVVAVFFSFSSLLADGNREDCCSPSNRNCNTAQPIAKTAHRYLRNLWLAIFIFNLFFAFRK